MYPAWLEGTWDCTETFRGYEFPSKVPKEKIVSRTSLPGFTKLSISRFADVGHQSTRYSLTFSLDDSGVVRESYADNIKASIEAHTDGREVVDGVDASAGNPNRMTIRMRAGGRNGERIEMFVNKRRSESLSGGDVFLCSEQVRQVTLGGPTLQEPGVARMVVGEYQHFFTYRRGLGGEGGGDDEGNYFRANVLTAVYVDTQQDSDLFTDVNRPVIVYSHNIVGKRV